MASISAFLPSFFANCFSRSGDEAREPVEAPQPAPRAAAGRLSPEHSCDAMAMATGKIDELYKNATHSRRSILQNTEMKDHFDKLATGQSPKYYVIACSDSRVSPPEIFRMKPGSMFEMQQLGALMPATPQQAARIGGDIEPEWANVSYAVRELKVEHLIILGHTGCGAVAGIMSPDAISHNAEVAAHLHKHRDLRERVNARFGGLEGNDKSLAAVGESVVTTLEKVLAFAPVKEAVDKGTLQVHGMVYEIANHGAISAWDADQQEFVIKNAEKNGDKTILPKRANTGSVA